MNHPLTSAIIALICITIFPTCHAQADDVLLADFEGASWGEWTVTGEAFGSGPAPGTLPGQMKVSGYLGNGLVNSFIDGDRTTGTLTSPPFSLDRRYLTFLVGGGGHAGKTCMNLVIDGTVVRTVAGDNTEPGGSEDLNPAFWDVKEFAGKTATLQIVDDATGTWGHINIDQIVLSDLKPAVTQRTQREKTFIVDSRYLVIPIQNGERSAGRIQLFVENREVRRYDLNIAPSVDKTDWYAWFTIDSYQGKAAHIVASKVTEEGFALVRPADTIPGQQRFYREPHRPQFHFTQKVGWNNDPNGMVYHDGTWHLFFQHNPVALPWGNMTWGHATSKDLLHWQQQPNKLFPTTMARSACFSGGATVDSHNTAGWGEGTLVAFLTDTGAGESVVWSDDGGKSFHWYEQNPVVKHQGRDPKVIWYAYDKDDKPLNDIAAKLHGHWVMAVYDEHPELGQNIAFYVSTNLKDWTEQSHLTGYFECPELFELAVDEDPRQTRWVIFAADARYTLGQFDGKEFTPEHEGKHQLHWGNYYASQTFDSAPDGRRIQIGWLRIDAPGPYNQHFSFPHQLTLRTTTDGVRMHAQPVPELEQLRRKTSSAASQSLIAAQPVMVPVSSDLLDVELIVDVGEANAIELRLPGRLIRYDADKQTLNDVPLHPENGQLRIRVLADHSLTEIIGNDGRVFISSPGPAELPAEAISVTAVGGDAKLISLKAHELKSIWDSTAAE